MNENEKKILIVDDSRGWLDYHRSAIKEVYCDKFTFDIADSARAGYDIVYNNLKTPYTLIISDLQMEWDFEPKLAGEWFIEQVKKLKEYKNVPIIIISATYNIKDIANRLEVNFLPKATVARNLLAYKLALDEVLKYSH